jgi:hypothetical protein
MNNHICILFCFNNIEHIKKCYESLKNDEIDFWVIENKSINSEEIESYFLSQDIKGYIQFNENITFKALEIFIKDYFYIINKYNFITVSDCDLEVKNSKETFDEIKNNLSFPNVGVSCVDLSLINFPYHIKDSDSWIPSKINENDNYIECLTGGHLMTIKNINLFLFQNKFLDSSIHKIVYSNGMKWVKTKLNKAIHLTWDLYQEDNPYFKFKKTHQNLLWEHNITSNYKILKIPSVQ